MINVRVNGKCHPGAKFIDLRTRINGSVCDNCTLEIGMVLGENVSLFTRILHLRTVSEVLVEI